VLIAAACDGAGSASHGGQGAAIAARALTENARRLPGIPSSMTDGLVREWIDECRDRIGVSAGRLGLAPRDFATTVVLVVSDGRETLCAHVGDGAAVVRSSSDGEWSALSWPEHGEYASTTYFLTDDPEPRVRISRSSVAIDRMVLMTDGLERLALDFGASRPHAPFFAGMTEPVAASGAVGWDSALSSKLGRYLESETVNSRTDDDKTLIMAALR
jgi:serine/threonine protein phosphatase PrpC